MSIATPPGWDANPSQVAWQKNLCEVYSTTVKKYLFTCIHLGEKKLTLD